MCICGSHDANPDLIPPAISHYAQETPFTHKLQRPSSEEPKKMTSRFAIPTFSPVTVQYDWTELLYFTNFPDAGTETQRNSCFLNVGIWNTDYNFLHGSWASVFYHDRATSQVFRHSSKLNPLLFQCSYSYLFTFLTLDKWTSFVFLREQWAALIGFIVIPGFKFFQRIAVAFSKKEKQKKKKKLCHLVCEFTFLQLLSTILR